MDAEKRTDPTIDNEYQRDWPKYFDAVKGLPHRNTLEVALNDLIGRGLDAARGLRPVAIDVGCGEGRDTRQILHLLPNWKLIAVDSSAEGLTRLTASFDPKYDAPRVRTELCRMEDLPRLYPAGVADHHVTLINASFALPFCAPDRFMALWQWIWDTLMPGGCFAGQLFGERDEWAKIDPRRHWSGDNVRRLLERYEVVHLEEAEKDGPDAMGGTKHHHVFHVVARKPRGEMPRQ